MNSSMSARAYAEKYVILAIRYFFGGHALVSGTNHYLTFFPDVIPRDPEIAGRFVQVLIDSHLYDGVKLIETLVGLSLLSGYFVPLALIAEMPVTVIICYLSVILAPSPRTLYSGPRELFFNIVLLFAYWGYFKDFVLTPRLPMKPLWHSRLPEAGP